MLFRQLFLLGEDISIEVTERADILSQFFDCVEVLLLNGVLFESLVDAVELNERAFLHREVIAEESVHTVGAFVLLFVDKLLLERMPVIMIDLILLLLVDSHEQVVADEVRLREVETGRVETLEDKLWVIALLGFQFDRDYL